MIDLLGKFYRRGWVSVGVILLTMVCLLRMTWFKWGDLIIDLGREVYVPQRLAEGALLYRDIFYLYGPFPPYFNALLFKIFGMHLLSLVIGGILVTALTAFFLYKISRMFLNVFFATFTVLAFLLVLAFGHYVSVGNYNFILPYSYPATHATLLVLGALYFFFRALDQRKERSVYTAGVCVFLCLLSRLEIGGMLVISVLVVALIVKHARPEMFLLRPLIFFPVVGAGLVYAAFFLMAGPRIMESNLLDLFKSNTQASPFSVLLSGVGQSAQNVQLMLKSAGSYLLLAAWFMCAGYAAQRVGHLKLLVWRRLLYGVVALLAGIGTILFLKSFYHFELQYRSLPLIYLTVGVLSILAYARSGRKVAELKLLALSLLSFLVVLRIILQVHAWHYGFYILVPGFIVYHVFFFRILPDLMRSKHAAVALYTGFTLVFLVLMADHFQFSRAMYQQRTLPVPSPRGEIRVFAAPNGQGVKALIEFFSEKTPPGTTLAVFPEGLMINFLSRRQNPLYYYSFLPQDMVRARVEQVMVDDMILKKPDYIVVLQRPVAEYGSRGFGVDYARQVLAYIEANYLPVAHTGPLPFASDNFSAVIFKRH